MIREEEFVPMIRVLLLALLLSVPLISNAASSDEGRFLHRLATADEDWMQAFAIHSLPDYEAEELLVELTQKKSLSAHAAYLVSLACTGEKFEPTCYKYRLHLKSLDADPGNLASYLLAMQTADDQQKEWLLQQAADKAVRSDLYWMRGGPAMLERTKDIPIDPEDLEEDHGISADAGPALRLLAHQMAIHTPSFNELSQLCDFEPMLADDRRQNCLKIGRMLQANGNTPLDYIMGNVLERKALLVADPDDPAAWRKHLQQGATHLAFQCWHQPMLDFEKAYTVGELAAYIQRLHEFGEVEGNRVHALAIHANQPERFATNPATCTNYLELPADQMQELLEEKEPAYLRRDQFEQEQAQARGAIAAAEEQGSG